MYFLQRSRQTKVCCTYRSFGPTAVLKSIQQLYSSCTAVIDILQYLTAKLLYIQQLKLLYNCCTSKRFSDFACSGGSAHLFQLPFPFFRAVSGSNRVLMSLEQFSSSDFLKKTVPKNKKNRHALTDIQLPLFLGTFWAKNREFRVQDSKVFFSGSGPILDSALKPVAAIQPAKRWEKIGGKKGPIFNNLRGLEKIEDKVGKIRLMSQKKVQTRNIPEVLNNFLRLFSKLLNGPC